MTSWRKWGSDALNSAPDFPGIYVLRLERGRAIERLIGSSDILYIGRSKNSTIKRRLTTHSKTNDPLKRVRKEVGEIEVSWRCLETGHMVKLWESDLIARYELEHIELPPLNRTQPWATLQQAKLLMPANVRKAMLEAANKNGYPLEIPDNNL